MILNGGLNKESLLYNTSIGTPHTFHILILYNHPLEIQYSEQSLAKQLNYLTRLGTQYRTLFELVLSI